MKIGIEKCSKSENMRDRARESTLRCMKNKQIISKEDIQDPLGYITYPIWPS